MTFALLSPVVNEAQCQQFQAVYLASHCISDNGTPNDPSDDTYEVEVYVSNDLNPMGTWTASGDWTGTGSYDPAVFTIGPFSIAAGDRMVTFTDDQNSNCSATIEIKADSPCLPPPPCGDFDVCVTLEGKSGCQALYTLTINADLQGAEVSLTNRSFSVTGGKVISAQWLNQNNDLSLAGVSVFGDEMTSPSSFGFRQLGGSFVASTDPKTYTASIVIEANAGECVNITSSQPTVAYTNWSSGMGCTYTASDCPIEEWCPETNTIGGIIEKGVGECAGTENRGIAGASVVITGPNGTTACEATTDESGQYSCETCQEGPYEVCATTTCPEPCGLSTLDIVEMQRSILRISKDYDSTIPYTGDLNGTGTVSGADIVLLRQILLGIVDVSEIENWCRFVPNSDLDEGLVNGSNTVDNCIAVNDASPLVDFVQYNLGDVNGSCTDCDHGKDDGDDDNDGLTFDDVLVTVERKATSIRVSTNQALSAVNVFSLKIPLDGAYSVESISGLTNNLDYTVYNGEIYIIWSDSTLLDKVIPNGTTLMEITVSDDKESDKTTAPRGFQELISISSGIHPISHRLEKRGTSVGSRSLTINNRHHIEISSTATINAVTVYTLQGQQIMQQRVSMPTDHLSIPPLDELSTGIYLVSLSTDEGLVTEKVFIQN